jgi:hypothetical protein
VALALGVAACAPSAVSAPAAETNAVSECDYRVRVESAEPLWLDVAASCRGRAVRGLESDDTRIANAVRSVWSDRGTTRRRENAFLLESDAREVTFRYRIDLDELAKRRGHASLALRSGDSLLAPSSSYLLYPWPLDVGIPVRVYFEAPASIEVASGLTREDDHYRLEAHEIPVSTYSAFGKLTRQAVEADARNAEVDIAVLDGPLAVSPRFLARWVEQRARAVASFYGAFPARRASVFVVPIPAKNEVLFGNLLPESSPAAELLVGSLADESALSRDWMLVHELFHIGVPSFHAEGKWFDEGLATYFEPIIRARAGLLDPLDAWREFRLQMPRAERALTRDGLEHSEEMYWGGAVFCLLADIEVRKKSNGRIGLEDGLRRVLAAGGAASDVWPLSKTLELADTAFPEPVLVPLWKRYGAKPAPLELEATFQALGVERAATGISLSERAPLAWVRRAIFEPSSMPSVNATR